MGIFGRRQAQPTADATDEQAVARYRYMLATAPPEDIEQAHKEAFERLTPEGRRQALEALARHVPPNEIRGDDPASLARAATRAEIRQPGTIERAWGAGGGASFGLGSWFLSTLAASFIGTAIAQSFFDNDPGPVDAANTGDGGNSASAGDGTATDSSSEAGPGDAGDGGGDFGGDFGGGDFGGGDLGGF